MKKEAKNLNKTKPKRRISLKSVFNFLKSSMQDYDIAAALKSNSKCIFMFVLFLLLSSAFVFADGWTNEPSHQTLFTDTITSKTDASPISIADAQGLYVTGNVGIGVAGPEKALHVKTTADKVAVFEDDDNPIIVLKDANAGVNAKHGGLLFNTQKLQFVSMPDDFTGSTPYMTIDTSSGNVGIGTANPNARLQVGNGDGETLQIGGTTSAPSGHKITFFSSNIEVGRIGLIDTVGSTAIGLFTYNGVSTTEKMRVDKNGNVGIGTTSPGSRLEVENTASADDVLLLEDSSGLCEAQPTTTGLTWSCSSDIRLKSNIRNASSVLGYIAGIPLKDYTVIKTGENVTGPIAQELLGEYPELVRLGDDGYYQVSELSQWTLVKAIQELKQGNDKLKSENSQLKTKLSNLESRIAKLEG